jgi:hypothetical protein
VATAGSRVSFGRKVLTTKNTTIAVTRRAAATKTHLPRLGAAALRAGAALPAWGFFLLDLLPFAIVRYSGQEALPTS